MIRPFIVPRQLTVTKARTIVPMVLPKTLEKAIFGRVSPRGHVPRIVSTLPTELMENM